MFRPSPHTTIIIPYQNAAAGHDPVNDQYFGKVPDDRLVRKEGVIYFKGDGTQRGKIGVGPQHALPYAASYDGEGKVLTLVFFTTHSANQPYVNSMWELQEHPYEGDVVNAYNDGPVDGGEPLGPFYELESSSPAGFLSPGNALKHRHSTIHISGDEKLLDAITVPLFGVGVAEISRILQ
jgi:hypothetical protein